MPMTLKIDVIKKCKLFHGCLEQDLKLILKSATTQQVKKGDPVFVVNDPSRCVYVVMSGAVEVLAQGNVRNQFIKIRTVKVNEHFSDLSVLAADRHHTSAFAAENTELLCIPASEFLTIIRQLPIVNANQMEILLGYYLNSIKRRIFLPMLRDVSDVRYDRRFSRLAALKLPSTRKAVPLRLESDILTVGFCLPISKELLDLVKKTYSEYKIKFTLLDDEVYEAARKVYLNFYSGQSSPSLVAKTAVRAKEDPQGDLEDLRSSTLLLSQLPPDVFASLAKDFEAKDFAEGDVIFSPNKRSDRFYFVGTGQVELSKPIETLGVQVAFASVDQYDIFFDTELFGENPQVTAVARSTCRIFSLSKDVFVELVRRPEFAVHFSITLAHLISALNRTSNEFEFFSGYSPALDFKTQPVLPLSKVKKSKILPLDLIERDLTLGVMAPNREVIDDAVDSYLRGFNVKICLITEENFKEWTSEVQAGAASEDTVTVFRNSTADNRILRPAPKDPTVALEQILDGAIESRGSDIHFEPNEKTLCVRYRIDGVITQLWDNIPIEIGLDIVRRVKVLCEMNIAENRLPQDGQFKFQKEDRESSFRVSSVPTRYGEKLVLRATGRKNSVIPLQLLAPNTKITKFFNRLVKYQQGIFFITGPTGSGKSTTLYSILAELNTRDRNIITIEDPIEANISGINQIEIDPSIGLTHESILRNVLRQDPDVIMVGEIRDSVSMQLALDAALAGQLVLTTIHAGNTLEVIPRIKELGGTPSHIASGLIGVMAQRLVRCLCGCKKSRAITSKEMEIFRSIDFSEPPTHVMEAVGCAKCNYTGFSGQIPIFEFWEKTIGVHNVLMDEGRSEDVVRAIRESNFESLTAYGLKVVAQGLTTVSEVNDVLFGITDLMAS